MKDNDYKKGVRYVLNPFLLLCVFHISWNTQIFYGYGGVKLVLMTLFESIILLGVFYGLFLIARGFCDLYNEFRLSRRNKDVFQEITEK